MKSFSNQSGFIELASKILRAERLLPGKIVAAILLNLSFFYPYCQQVKPFPVTNIPIPLSS
jgi:hypothetical protein